MQAAFIEKTGSPELIRYGQLPLPALAAGEVLVRVQAVTVDPIDTYIRGGLYKVELPLPFILGRDMVGTVAEVGPAVSMFKTGDVVWCNNQGYDGRQGTFSEFVVISQWLLYLLPTGADPINTVASVHSALTAVEALIVKANLQQGERIFINGGSGNVGTLATQLAKHLGAFVAVTAGSPEKAQLCKDSGADLIIDYKTEDIRDRLNDFAPNRCDVVWDLTSNPDVQLGLDILVERGRILLSSGLRAISSFNVGSFYTKNCSMYGFTVTGLSTKELSERAVIINRYINENVWRAKIALSLPLSETARAHALMENGGISGKIVLLPD